MRKLVFSLMIFIQLSAAFHLSAEDTITISVFEDHDRYVLASNSYGLSWRLTEYAAANAALKIVPQESSWRGSMNRLEANKIDLIFGAIYSEERDAWGNFSLPLVTTGSGIFTRLDNPVNSLDEIDFENSVIGVSLASVQEEMAREMGFENIYSTVQRPQLYAMINAKRIDYLFFGKSIINYYCVNFNPNRDPNCLKQVGDLFHPSNLHLMSNSKNSKANQKLDKINKSIVQISQTEKVRRLFAEYHEDNNIYSQWLGALKKHSGNAR